MVYVAARTRIPRLISSHITHYRTPRQSSLAWLGVRYRIPSLVV